jgi:hypothetical protein
MMKPQIQGRRAEGLSPGARGRIAARKMGQWLVCYCYCLFGFFPGMTKYRAVGGVSTVSENARMANNLYFRNEK